MSNKLRLLSKSFNSIIRSSNVSIGRCFTQQPTFKLITNANVRSFSASLPQNNIYAELNQFLNKEIRLEKETRKSQPQVPQVKGFEVKTEGPNVTLTRTHNAEKVTVKLNVNHSLDTNENIEETVADAEKDQGPTPMKSRPAFTVDISKDGKTLSFGCSFLPPEEGGKESSEDFQIDEFAIHDGEWNENVYTVDCSVLDGQLYDILLNLLEERGLGEAFANELAEFSTSYEHLQYVNLLEKLKDFSA